MAQSSETKLNKIFDQDVQITGNLTVDGNLVGFSGDNFYLDGITKSGNTLTFSVNGTTNQTYTFGSNAFTSYTNHATAGYLVTGSNGTNIGEVRFAHTTYSDPQPGVTRDAKFGDDGIAASEVYSLGKLVTAISNGAMISTGAATDAFGYNSNYGHYIKGVGTTYIYGNGSFYDGSTNRTLIHSGNIGSQSVSYATSAGNADTVDGYHASNLWRSDGAAWNPSANVILNQSANSQEWSFDINRNGYSGGYWQVWDSSNSTMLKVDAVNGKVYAPYNFVGNLEGNASSASSVAWSNVSSKPAGWLSTTNLITNSNPNATAFPSGFYEHSDGANTPTGTWFNYINVRHSNVGNGHGFQLGMSYYDNNLWFRSYKGALSPTFESWETALATGGSNQTKSGYLQSNNSLRAPVFYDSNDTNWWIDPNGSSSAKFRQFVQIGDSSSYNTNSGSWGARLNVTDDVHARIDVAQDANGMHSHWYAHTGQSSIKFGTTSNHGVEFISNNSGRGQITSGGTLEWWNNVTGRIYYDYDNTAYFLDPTSTSYLKNLSIESGNVIMRNSRTLNVSGDPDTFYPVVFSHSATTFTLEIRKHVHNYQTWDGRLAARIKSWSSTWGGDQGFAYVEENAYTTRKYIAKVSQSSGPNNYLVVWLRGSRSYNVYTTPYDSVGTPYYSSTDLGSSNGTVSPTTTPTLPYIRFQTNSIGHWISETKIKSNDSIEAPIFYDSNDTGYYVDLTSDSLISGTLNISGNTGGSSYGNQLVVGQSSKSLPYTSQDTNARTIIYATGKYPVLTLNHTVTTNTNHGPTIQFTHNGANSNAQWVAGTNGTGSQFQIGWSNSGLGNSNFNPHHGIAGYNGVTALHIDDSYRVGIGANGDWGGLGGGNPVANIHLKAPQTYSSYGSFHGTVIQSDQNGGGKNGSGLLVVNDNGNHSWGVVAEFRVNNNTIGADRSSIAFTTDAYSGQSWTLGYAHNSGSNFRIKRDHGWVSQSWGTTLMEMDRNGNVTFTGDVVAYSDERLKKDIKTIENPLDTVKQLRGVTYKLKENDKESIGLIAQEVEKVLPQVVLETEGDVDADFAPKGVAYGNIVGVLIEAVKEQQKQIDELKKLINP